MVYLHYLIGWKMVRVMNFERKSYCMASDLMHKWGLGKNGVLQDYNSENRYNYGLASCIFFYF